MHVIDLNHTNRAEVLALLADNTWCVACLCAAWCMTCASFRTNFEALAARHPDKVMLWIDIENEAEVVGEFDIENFPTLLIQRGARVAFLGTIEPNVGILHRLVEAKTQLCQNPVANSNIDNMAGDNINPNNDKANAHSGTPLPLDVDLRTKLAALLPP